MTRCSCGQPATVDLSARAFGHGPKCSGCALRLVEERRYDPALPSDVYADFEADHASERQWEQRARADGETV